MTTKKTAVKAEKKPPTKKVSAPARPITKSAVKAIAKAAPQLAAKNPGKERKKKVVRDSFTMPQSEYAKIAEIKAICLKAKVHVKKSEVLRAGLKLLAELNATELKAVLASLEKIKTGRPQKH